MFDVDLAGLNLTDDLNIGEFGVEEAGEYQDQSAPPPPREGNIRIVITDFAQAKDFDTKAPKFSDEDKKWPVFVIRKFEILEPEELNGRQVLLNQEVATKPRKRKGAKGESLYSDFADLLRSFDATRFTSLPPVKEGLEMMREFVESRQQARVRTQWRAFDKKYADDQIAAKGGRAALSNEELGRINGAASIRGMAKFTNGEVKGPSGEIIRAKLKIVQYYPSTDPKVRLYLA